VIRSLVVVPTHNEADNIGRLICELRAVLPTIDVMVVDDASSDDTRQTVRELAGADPGLRLVERDTKRGLGDAYLHAFGLAVAEGYDAVVQLDADLSHDPAVLPMMLDLADRGIALVIGSRYIPGGTVTGWPRRRTWLSRWGNRYVAIMLGLAINDATAGFRVYRTDTLAAIGLDGVQASGYGFQVEMAYRVVRAGLSVVEVPIAFTDRVAGDSKMGLPIIAEAFRLVTIWGVQDMVSLKRRRRAYRTLDRT
jgi:dolichol-phosphate mannosyltransferase